MRKFDKDRSSIPDEAREGGATVTGVTFVLAMAAFEAINYYVGSQLHIPKELIIPAILAVHLPETFISAWVALSAGMAYEDSRSLK